MSIDTTNIDLCALIEQRATITLARVSNSAGGEFKGPCPWCGGRDRFFVQPYAERPHYHCRVCERSGDALQFLQDYENMTFKEALVELELAEDEYVSSEMPRLYDDPPPAAWQSAARDFLERAEKYLWHPNSVDGQRALEYLRGRGLTDETIKGVRLGYCPLTKDGSWFTDSLEHWGLNSSQTTKDVVRIPDGIILPWITVENVWKICVKRPWAKDDELRYGQVVGSGEGLYNAPPTLAGKPVMMVEGEFDCLSVQQETDLVTCVATGSASRGRTQRWIDLLKQASIVLQSFDSDQAGDDGAKFWLETLSNSMRWRCWGKDANEMFCKDSTIKIWVETGIDIAFPSQPYSASSAPQEMASEQPDEKTPEQENCSFCGVILDEIGGFEEAAGSILWYCPKCWKDHRFTLNAMKYAGGSCPVVNETKNKLHGRYPVEVLDNAGYRWCGRCMTQPRLMNIGADRSWPAFYFIWANRSIFVETGEEAWFQFACNGGYAQVTAAIEMLEKQPQKHSEVLASDF